MEPAAALGFDSAQGHVIGVGLALGVAQLRDDLLVPLRFAGPALALTGSYAYFGRGWDTELRLRLAVLGLFDRFGTFNFAIDPAIEGRVHVFEPLDRKGLRVRLGLAAGMRQLVAHYVPWNDSHLYWLAATSLGPSGSLSVPLEGRELRFDLALPVVALVSRPEQHRLHKVDPLTRPGFWLGRFASQPELATLNRFTAATLRASWRSKGPGLRLEPYLELDWIGYRKPVFVGGLTAWVGAELRWSP